MVRARGGGAANGRPPGRPRLPALRRGGRPPAARRRARGGAAANGRTRDRPRLAALRRGAEPLSARERRVLAAAMGDFCTLLKDVNALRDVTLTDLERAAGLLSDLADKATMLYEEWA